MVVRKTVLHTDLRSSSIQDPRVVDTVGNRTYFHDILVAGRLASGGGLGLVVPEAAVQDPQ